MVFEKLTSDSFYSLNIPGPSSMIETDMSSIKCLCKKVYMKKRLWINTNLVRNPFLIHYKTIT